MYDTYPNFGLEKKDESVHFALDYEEPANRLTNALRLIWAIPALITTIGLVISGDVVTLICWFAILFTGTQPSGMFDFLIKAYRYALRTSAYVSLLTDTYPKYE